MKKLFISLALVAGISFWGCQKEELVETKLDEEIVLDDQLSLSELKHGDIIPNSFIVVFNETKNLMQMATKFDETKSSYQRNFKSDDEFLRELYKERVSTFRKEYEKVFNELEIRTESIEFVYTGTVYGVAATLSEKDCIDLEQNPNVDYIEPNRFVQLDFELEKDIDVQVGAKAQTTPWGISHVGAAVYSGDKVAWILDTGIQTNHPDLNVWTGASRSFVSGETYNDGNGHGTHVSGTIAAIHNSTGVVGVAAGAWVVAVKVLSNQGGGSYAGIISGVDYVRSNAWAGDVVNMSLGGPASTALDNAVKNLANTGVWCVLAAGNEYSNANYSSPARVNGTYIYTVSAHDINNRFASFSNYGNPPIDWCAPGVSIYSTWIGSSYRTISGTSMAAPHVAGIRLLGTPRVGGYVLNDPDGNADRRAIK